MWGSWQNGVVLELPWKQPPTNDKGYPHGKTVPCNPSVRIALPLVLFLLLAGSSAGSMDHGSRVSLEKNTVLALNRNAPVSAERELPVDAGFRAHALPGLLLELAFPVCKMRGNGCGSRGLPETRLPLVPA